MFKAIFSDKNLNPYLEILIIIIVSVSPVVSIYLQITLCAVLLFFNRNYFQFNNGILFTLLLCFFIPSIIDLIKNSEYTYSLTNIAFPLYFISGYIIARKYTFNDFMVKFEKIMSYLAILSLIGYSVYFINPSLILSFPSYEQLGVVHHTIYFYNYLFANNEAMVRNSGIAWEPGVFQMLLNIALIYNLKEERSLHKHLKTFVYILSIYFAKSTMGYLLLAIVLITMLKNNKIYIYLIFALISAYLPFIEETVRYQIEYKSVGTDSFQARFIPMINAYNISLNEFYGIGSSYYKEFSEKLKIGSFDSYSQIFLRYGYPLLIYYLYRIFRLFKADFLVGLIIFISFFSEPLWFSVLMTTIIYLRISK